MAGLERLVAEPLGWCQALRASFANGLGSVQIRLGRGFGTNAMRHRIERRLAFWQAACGCQAAALAMVLGLIWQAAAASTWWPIDGWAVAYALGQALVAAVAAKITVLLLARLAIAVELRGTGSAQPTTAPKDPA